MAELTESGATVFVEPMVNLYSGDVERAVRFYRDLLGFVESFRTPKEGTPTHVELRLGGFMVALSSVEAARTVHGIEPTPGSPAISFVLWTADVDAQYERLVGAGTVAVQPPHDRNNNNRSALLRDPDGNLVEIVAKRA